MIFLCEMSMSDKKVAIDLDAVIEISGYDSTYVCEETKWRLCFSFINRESTTFEYETESLRDQEFEFAVDQWRKTKEK